MRARPLHDPFLAGRAFFRNGAGWPHRRQKGPALRYAEIPAGAYSVVAQVRAKPGKERQSREATLTLVARVRDEPNNLLYFLHENREAPGHFAFYEIFASQADFEAQTPHPMCRHGSRGCPNLPMAE